MKTGFDAGGTSFALWGATRRFHLARHGSGLRRLMARSSFYRPPASTPSRRRQSVLAGGDRSRPGGIAAAAYLRLRVCRDIPFRLMRREQSALAPRAAAVAAIPMSVRSVMMAARPWIFTVGTPMPACLQATLRRPAFRTPWGLPGCMARRGRRGSGAGLAGSHYRRDHRSSSGADACRRAPDQRRRRAVQSHAEGTIIHGPLPQHRGAAGRRPRLRRTLQCPVDRRKERLPEPRSSSSGVARRDLNQARRVRQTCVQGTGCATPRNNDGG